MATLFDHAGRPVQLGASIGKGGEGEVFEINSSQVAKLYHKAPDASKAAKLTHMVGATTPDLLKIAAWPITTLHNRANGPVLGFVMPRMAGVKSLHLLYGPVSRRREFPDRNWDFLVQVAINCAAAFDTVHATGAVIGDVNANNIQTASNAFVRLIDCDSFQFTAHGQQFLCEVGVPEYTPPDLQEKPFKGVVRSANHDNFGLAVLIFQLLFMGRHPFFGRYGGKDALTQERAIRELRFAFGRHAAAKQMSAPPHVLPFSVLPSGIADLFERAFADSTVKFGRPSPIDWLSGLRHLQGQLTGCAVDPTHKFPTNAGACPWCAIAAKGGPAFFISAQLALDFVCASGDLDGLFAELHKFLRERSEPQLTSAPVPAPSPLSPAAEGARKKTRVAYVGFGITVAMFGFAASGAIAGVGVVASAAAIITAAATVALLLWVMWLQNWSPLGVERRTRVAEYSTARAAYAQIRFARDQQIGQFREAAPRWKHQADQLRADYSRLRSEYDAELATMTRNSEAAHKHAFLENFEVVDAKIEKLGPAKKKALVHCGIETAWDVLNGDIDSVPGIGPTLRERLVSWAQSVELRFRFDPAKGLPEGDRRALVARYRHRQIAIRGNVEAVVSQCRQAANQHEAIQKKLLNDALAADVRLKKAEAELASVPRRASWPIVAGLGIVGLWLGGFAIFKATTLSTSTPAVAAVPPTDAGVDAPRDDFQEGLEIVATGTGAPRRLRFEPRDGMRQRMELTLEVTQSAGNAVGRLPKTSVQALVSTTKTKDGTVDYTVTLEKLRVTDSGALDATEQEFKAAIGKLAGSSLTITVTPTGTVTGTRVGKQTQTSDLYEFPSVPTCLRQRTRS